MQARQSKHCIGGSTSRERERKRDVCVIFEFHQFVFLYSGNVFQRFVSIFAKKKFVRMRCLAVSSLGYNLGHKITVSEVQY